MTHLEDLDPARTYEEYLAPAIAHPWTRVLLDIVNPQPGDRVLDVACGTGSVARHVAPLVGAQGKVIALDISAPMLAIARALPAPPGAAIEWRQGDATCPDVPDAAVEGAATSIPTFARLDAAERSALVDVVTGQTQPVVERYRPGSTLTFPMSTHITVAYAGREA